MHDGYVFDVKLLFEPLDFTLRLLRLFIGAASHAVDPRLRLSLKGSCLRSEALDILRRQSRGAMAGQFLVKAL